MACPACGAPTQLIDAHCPECGQALVESDERRDRPRGVTLLALYGGLRGLLAVLTSLPAVVRAAVADPAFFRPSEAIALQALSLLLPVVGGLYLALAYGVWTRPRWAYPRARTLFLAQPCLALALWVAAPPGPTQLLLLVAECAGAVAALIYCRSDRARTYFGWGA